MHSYDAPRSSVKRVMEDRTPAKRDERFENYRRKFQTRSLDLWPEDTGAETVLPDGTQIFAHSFGVPAESKFARLTHKSTNGEVISALHHDILTGRRKTGLPPQFFHSNNLLTDNPGMYLDIVTGMEGGRVLSNKDVGLFGLKDSEDGLSTVSSDELPVICRLAKSRLAQLKTSAMKTFGEI